MLSARDLQFDTQSTTVSDLTMAESPCNHLTLP